MSVSIYIYLLFIIMTQHAKKFMLTCKNQISHCFYVRMIFWCWSLCYVTFHAISEKFLWSFQSVSINFIIFNRSWNVVTKVGMEAGILNVPIYRKRSPALPLLMKPDDGMMRVMLKETSIWTVKFLIVWIFWACFLDHNPAIPVARPLCITQARAGESLLLVIY